MSKVIEELQPYNKFFFKSCLYNSFFSILEYYKISLLNILAYTDGYYRLCEKNQICLEYIDVMECSSEKEILVSLAGKAGMEIRIYEQEPELSFINHELTLAHPVIAVVDCYYMPYRTDVYKKRHFIHPFLVKGYDERLEEYYVIDQINDESLTYSDFTIGRDELEHGLKAYNTREAESYYYCLSSYCYNGSNNLDLSKLKGYAVDIKKAYHQKFYQGLCAIATYVKAFNVEDLIDNIDSVILKLNDIVNFKLVEKHKVEMLFEPPNKELNELMNSILGYWKAFRRDLYMFYCSNKKDASALFDKLKNLLCNIHAHEKKYYEIFSQL